MGVVYFVSGILDVAVELSGLVGPVGLGLCPVVGRGSGESCHRRQLGRLY